MELQVRHLVIYSVGKEECHEVKTYTNSWPEANGLTLEKKKIRILKKKRSGEEVCRKTYERGYKVWRILYHLSMPRSCLLQQKSWITKKTKWFGQWLQKAFFIDPPEMAWWADEQPSHSGLDGGHTLALWPLNWGWSSYWHLWMFSLPTTNTKWTPVDNSVTLELFPYRRTRRSHSQG